MKNYENPIISVSLFDVENVVTESGMPEQTAVEQANDFAEATYGAANIIKVTF